MLSYDEAIPLRQRHEPRAGRPPYADRLAPWRERLDRLQ